MHLPGQYQTNKSIVVKNFNAAAENYEAAAVLQKEVAMQVLERLKLMKVNPGIILDLGSGTGVSARRLGKIFDNAFVVQLDLSEKMLARSAKSTRRWFSRQSFICAEAQSLPFAPSVFGLTHSNLMLQWCNDIAIVFSEVRRVVRPGGLFMFSSFGPDTLRELRSCWATVDSDAHVNAFVDMHDVGDALMRTGFEQPVIEAEKFTLTYDSVPSLFQDLKLLGATNANTGRRRSLTGKRRLARVIEAYEKYRVNGKIPATYEVVYGHAWNGPVAGAQGLDKGVFVVPVSSLRRRER